MPWAKLDDQLHSNDKVEEAGLEAMGLWTLALSHAAALLTDGFVSAERVRRIAGNPKRGVRLAERLCAARLWHRADEPCPAGHDECDRTRRSTVGYRFHDWDDYQASRDDVEAGRARKKRNLEQHRARKSAQSGESGAEATVDEVGVKSISGRLQQPAGNRGEIVAPPIPSDPIRSDPIRSDAEKAQPETVVLHSIRGNPAGGSAATVTDRVSEELERSPKTRKLATAEWASELVLLAGAVRADDLCAAIRKCVVGAPEGLTEAALKQRIVGFVANARNIEAVRRTRAREVEEPAKPHPPGYIPLGLRPDIPPPPPLFTGDPNEPILDSPFPFLNAMGGKS